MNEQYDVIVVGSGPAGVSAAYPLIKAGLKVAIIDGGLESGKENAELDDFSDINLKETSNAYGLFKNNSFIFNTTYKWLRIKSKIEIIQTLSKGGFSKFWHGISDFFTPSELQATGLPVDEIQKEYDELVKKINIETDLPLDIHNQLILQTYKNNSNLDSSIYRLPSATNFVNILSIDVFRKFKNFTYIPNQVVDIVKDKSDFIEIQTISIPKSLRLTFKSRFLILAAGSINSTRILLRSLDLFDYQTTFLTKAHYIIACLHTKALIKKKDFKKVNLGQLALSSKESDRGLNKFFIQIFRFSPTAVEKATKYLPLPKPLTQFLIKLLSPSLVVADVRFPDFETKNKFCKLVKDSGNKDILEIHFTETKEELADHQQELKKIKQQLKSLGLIPLKTGSDYITSHYAGGIPYQETPGKVSVDKNGKLHQAKRIFVADASTWRTLPAKPPTLTIMANASRIGKKVLKLFKGLEK